MFLKRIVFVAMAIGLITGAGVARAQDSGALLELLVKKGLISDQEAEDVRADLVKENAGSPAGKLKLSTPLTELEIYGDARVRYEIRNGQSAAPDPINRPGDTFQRNRARYRLRIGLRGTLVDDWFFGVRLETSTNPRSTNVTFGDDTSTGPGPFAKNSDSIGVGQAYVGYKGIRDLTLTAGKMANPFITSSMVWDGDINPEGLAEQWKHTFNFALGGGSSAAVESMSKDGKTVATAATAGEPQKISLDLYANFGQFVYDDTNPENPIGPSPSGLPKTDAYLLGWQIGAKLNFPHNLYLQISPTVYNYTGNGDTFATHFSGDPAFTVTDPVTGVVSTVVPNQTGINSLLVVEVPVEFGFKLGELPVRVFGDFAINVDGAERARAAGHPDQTDQNIAYQIGAGIGSTKKKGDYSLTAFWQHAEQYSLDPNLVDSDIYDSRVNLEGAFVQLGYALSDAVTVNLTYAHGWQIDHNLGTRGVGDLGINPVDDYNLFQADLSFKF